VRPLHGGFALDIFHAAQAGTARLRRKILSPSASAAADRGLNCGRERRASRRDRESDGPQADDSFLTNVVQKLGADFNRRCAIGSVRLFSIPSISSFNY